MRPFIVGFLFLLACASECFAYKSIAMGYRQTEGGLGFLTAASSETSAMDAQIAALQACRNQGGNNCSTVGNVENSCWAVARVGTEIGQYPLNSTGTGQTPDQAVTNAIAACTAYRGAMCNWGGLTVCDGSGSRVGRAHRPPVQPPTPSNPPATGGTACQRFPNLC
jgi:hypothetical protein